MLDNDESVKLLKKLTVNLPAKASDDFDKMLARLSEFESQKHTGDITEDKFNHEKTKLRNSLINKVRELEEAGKSIKKTT